MSQTTWRNLIFLLFLQDRKNAPPSSPPSSTHSFYFKEIYKERAFISDIQHPFSFAFSFSRLNTCAQRFFCMFTFMKVYSWNICAFISSSLLVCIYLHAKKICTYSLNITFTFFTLNFLNIKLQNLSKNDFLLSFFSC